MIVVDKISFSYSESDTSSDILFDVSLTIQPGEAVAVMGHNGSGKTTFARCLNGLLLPTRGQVTVDGLSTSDSKNLQAIRRRVGMVFQNPDNQIVSATVEREIAFGLENLGMSYEAMHETVERVLEEFDLVSYRLKSPHYLSGGEKQRLALAAVMAMRPQYLILDEPTSLLDPAARQDILDNVENLRHQSGRGGSPVSTILITQFPEEALRADRLVVFSQGRIAVDDFPLEIFKQHEWLESIGLESPMEIKVQRLLKNVLNG